MFAPNANVAAAHGAYVAPHPPIGQWPAENILQTFYIALKQSFPDLLAEIAFAKGAGRAAADQSAVPLHESLFSRQGLVIADEARMRQRVAVQKYDVIGACPRD